MPELSAAATLDLWESGEGLGPVERALALAGAAGPASASAEELARLPLGRRDARVLELHSSLAGPLLRATAPCPSCGEQAEFEVDASVLLAQGESAEAPARVESEGFVVEWRSPDSIDVARAAECTDVRAAEEVLLARCVTSATGPEGAVDATALPVAVRPDAVSDAMAQADPLAEVLVDVACPSCGEEFAADLDVGSFVWAELNASALRLLRDVEALARAFGWTEAEVLSLSRRRRAAYLALAREEA